MARRDPRKRVVGFRDYCPQVSKFEECPNWYLPIRAPRVVRRKWPIALDESEASKFAAGIAPYQTGLEICTPEVFLAQVTNAKVVGDEQLVLSPQNHIFLESALSRQEVLEKSGLLDAVIPPRPPRQTGMHCLISSPWSHSHYYHWIIDALPRLSIVEQFRELRKTPLIVPRTLKPFHHDSLRLAGIEPERITSLRGGECHAGRLLFPSLLSPSGNPCPDHIAWLRSKYLKEKSIATPKRRRRLYVSRGDATQRRILNEDHLISIFVERGFEVICPGQYSFIKQIEIFRDAEIVAGPHGAGFTNMVFAPPDATLLEFYGDNYINGCFWALANISGQRHAFLTSPTSTLDYIVSIDRARRIIEKLGF